MRKRYEVKGMMEWHPEFKVGRTRIQVSFTGGHLCGGAATAATFETSDPVVQAVIERSAPFLNGRIRLCGSASKTSVDIPTQTNVSAAPPTVMEFDNIDKASDFLQYTKGVPLGRLITTEQIDEEAHRLGLKLKLKNSPSQ